MRQLPDIKDFPNVSGNNINESSLLDVVTKCPQCLEDLYILGGQYFQLTKTCCERIPDGKLIYSRGTALGFRVTVGKAHTAPTSMLPLIPKKPLLVGVDNSPVF